ncbi:MAG: putative transcriptional regulator, XRE family [Dehalococcoidia bacterium]|nr:putative transcriptional regulator, XRE family [Dehalococcoidia bacterium]
MGTISKQEQVWESLQDPELRQQFIDEHINVGLAFQIRALRVRQDLTQTKLAELLGSKSKQPMVSEWENPNYGKYTLETLKDLAKVFDVGLLVRFVPFSQLVEWTVDLTKEAIAPPKFSEEQNYAHDLTSVSTAWNSTEGAITITANNQGFSSHDMPGFCILASTANVKTPEKELVHA